MSDSPKAVFLSYASQDAEAAGRICDALRAVGLDVWFDQSALRGGDAWDAAIRKQVKDCALFLPLISANTEARSEGYFRREWNLAVARMLDMAEDQPFVFAVVIDDTPENLARVPERFRERQWTRLIGGLASGEFTARVARILEADRSIAPTVTGAARRTAVADSGPSEEGFWVAVLPFKSAGSNADVTALADAFVDEIVTGMARFSYLKVIARSTTARYANMTADARVVGREIGARYLMEGSLRHAGTRLRLTVQLVDTANGAHLWAENYERAFNADTVFELQNDLVPRIVSTVADMTGVLARSMSDAVRSRDPDQLSPYEAVLRSFGYFDWLTPEDLGTARAALEAAVQCSPNYADAWAMLALLCYQDYAQGFNLQADCLANALSAAQRAVALGPSNALAHWSLAPVLYLHGEFQGFRNSAERAIALNPMDGNAIASLASMLYYQDPERGLELAARAKQLNPNHPGWYWLVDSVNAYFRGDYESAIKFALKTNLPKNLGMRVLIAAAYGQLGDREAASAALDALLKLRPSLPTTVRMDLAKWWQPWLAEPVIDGLRKAGLALAATEGSEPQS